MRKADVGDWLVDAAVVVGLVGVAVFLLPLASAVFVGISLQLDQTLYWVHSIVLGYLLPSVLIGSLLGLTVARIIRHRKLVVALLPSVLLCLFYLLYYSFGPDRLAWGRTWVSLVIIASWLLLILTSGLCATWTLHRRNRDLPSPSPV